jgi:hypothetical protein
MPGARSAKCGEVHRVEHLVEAAAAAVGADVDHPGLAAEGPVAEFDARHTVGHGITAGRAPELGRHLGLGLAHGQLRAAQGHAARQQQAGHGGGHQGQAAGDGGAGVCHGDSGELQAAASTRSE